MPRTNAPAWFAIRWEILQRDEFTCQYCGQYAPNVRLEVDHKIAVVDGGTDASDNLTTSCSACNRGKEGYRARMNGRTRTESPRKLANRLAEEQHQGWIAHALSEHRDRWMPIDGQPGKLWWSGNLGLNCQRCESY